MDFAIETLSTPGLQVLLDALRGFPGAREGALYAIIEGILDERNA